MKRTDLYKKKIITIPNILSLCRICLIPFIVWFYLAESDFIFAGILVIISGVTDIVDGFIARRFDMISDVGKVLDPVADKATQIVVIILLIMDFPLMLIPLGISIVKELFMAITGYMVIKKRDIVLGANWHGKLATVIMTVTMILHIVWHNILPIISTLTIIISAASVLLSLALYAKRNFAYLNGTE